MTHFVYSLYYTRTPQKKKPPSPQKRGEKQGKEPGLSPRLQSKLPVYFWKLTPTTVTFTWETSSPLVFSTALNTASCTALATSVTT